MFDKISFYWRNYIVIDLWHRKLMPRIKGYKPVGFKIRFIIAVLIFMFFLSLIVIVPLIIKVLK